MQGTVTFDPWKGFQNCVFLTRVDRATNISIYGLDGAINILNKSTNYSRDESSLFNWNRVMTSKRLLRRLTTPRKGFKVLLSDMHTYPVISSRLLHCIR